MKRKKGSTESQGRIAAIIRQGARQARELDIEKLRVAAKPLLLFFAAFALGGVRLPLGVYPFGGAMVSAVSGGISFAAVFLGAVLSTLSLDTGAMYQILILFCIGIVRLGACFMRGDFAEKRGLWRRLFCERGYIKTVYGALCAAGAGCVMIIESNGLYYGIFSALFGIGCAVLITAAFVFFWDRGSSASKRTVGLLVILSGGCAWLSSLGMSFDAGAVVAFWIALWLSDKGTAALGCAAGAVCALPFGAEYCVAFASLGMVYTVGKDYSVAGAVSAAGAVAGVLSLFCGGTDAIGGVIPEIAFATAVAAPVMSLGLLKLPVPDFICGESIGEGEERESMVVERLGKVGESFEGIYSMLKEIGSRIRLPEREECARICNSARKKHCTDCKMRGECDRFDRQTVESMFGNMEYRLSTNGRISARIVPDSVAARCYNMDSIINYINTSAKRAVQLSGGGRQAELFGADYKAISGMLEELLKYPEDERDRKGELLLQRELSALGFGFRTASVYGKRRRRVYMRGVDTATVKAGEEDVRECAQQVLECHLTSPEFVIDANQVNAVMHSKRAFKVAVGKSAVKSGRDNTSGDSVCSFENEEGYFYTLVSDGMGSGVEAALTSGVTAGFLEKLLGSGCPMRSALELLNTFVRGTSGECFTTVDLLEIDLYTGRARFVKSGAAPSFVIRDGRLFRLHSKTVPVGIMRALDAEAVSFELCCGDTVIMISDGVTGSFEDCPWLYELLCSGLMREGGCDGISKRIAAAAVKNNKGEDDVTVCVMKIEAA